MKERRLCYISRTYYNQTSAGNKAKTDYEKVLHSMGAASIGLPC
ncbi:galactofuranosyltransferase, partial [Prevotella copri]|nr:galactofuranosyltransferase [Segatella copri]